MGRVYAGTSGWAYTSWRPKFYPAKLPPAKFLGYYATRLNSVEVNYTFRAAVTQQLLADWIGAASADFMFAIKAPQLITHILRLRGVEKATTDFLASLKPLAKAGKLGPVLFQLPPNFKCDLLRLDDFLKGLPRKTRVTMEFRHPSWFVEEVYKRLRRANVALCEAESDDLVTPETVTANFCYFRLRKEKYPPAARQAVSRKVKKAARKGDVFVYFKHQDTPAGAFYAESLLQDFS